MYALDKSIFASYLGGRVLDGQCQDAKGNDHGGGRPPAITSCMQLSNDEIDAKSLGSQPANTQLSRANR